MIGDGLFISALICIGTACVLSFLLGRYLGMAAAFESLRPLLPSDRGESDPYITGLFHSGTHNGTEA
jgi:hypothetical protein